MPDLAVLVRQLQGALGGRSLDGGLVTLTWPGGSAYSAVLTVDHELKELPGGILGTADLPAGGFSFEVAYVPAGVTSSQLQLRGHTTDGTVPGAGVTRTASWLAFT